MQASGFGPRTLDGRCPRRDALPPSSAPSTLESAPRCSSHAAPNVHPELLDIDLNSCEILFLHLSQFVRVREEESKIVPVRVNVLHKSRHHREKTPEEIPAQRVEGDNTDQDVEFEACATVGHSLKRNRRGDVDFRKTLK